jgi:CheY-like chemotaxis protein
MVLLYLRTACLLTGSGYARRMGLRLDGVSVLWVDDHPGSIAVPIDVLRRSGAVVLTATSNDEAIELASAHVVDLVVSDIDRGEDEDGSELGIRLVAAGVHVPLLHFVGRIDPDLPPPVGSLGVTNDPHELLTMIREAVRRTG